MSAEENEGRDYIRLLGGGQLAQPRVDASTRRPLTPELKCLVY